jgi:uncharacterized glyoxalase superfamily protein PhnB
LDVETRVPIRGAKQLPANGFGGILFGMSADAKNCTSTVIPALRYRDAPAAIEWLCRAFGFERRAVYMADEKTVAHAELTLGNGMIMIGSVSTGTAYSDLIRQPEAVGAETQSPYLVVADCAAVYASARVVGAEMVMDLEEKEYGGKGFTCRDPEGHVWSVGEYDPWAQQAGA